MPRAATADVRSAIVRACRRLDAKGLVAGAEGNVSARVGAGAVLVTPAGAIKAWIGPADLVRIRLSDGKATGNGRPSSELPMHLAIYAARPDVAAVVHAHPPAATGFAVARRTLRGRALAELVGVVGPVPLVAYHDPGTPALGAAVASALSGRGSVRPNACLLANHGVVAVGRSVEQALSRIESLEQAARILATAHILGGVTEIGPAAVNRLQAVYAHAGAAGARRGTRRGTRRGRRK